MTSPDHPAQTPSSDLPPGYRLRRGRNWFFLGLTYAAYYLCRYNLAPVANELKTDLNLDNKQYGVIQSGRDGAYAVGQMINGLFTDRLGGKRAMTIGAVATIVLNLAFGLATWSTIGGVLWLLVVLRSADGFFQAYGAPGMVKINTAWFRRRERGAFAGIFGAMINLGQLGANQLGVWLATGLTITVAATSFTLIPKLDWRYMFLIPPVVVAVIVVLMNLAVKNHPEEAGYRIVHDDESADDDPHERVRLMDVVRKIAPNPIVWMVAGAYFCTGFVRRAVDAWYAVYLRDAWNVGRESTLFAVFALGLPIVATAGSLASGYISDTIFRGRRAPVAALLYLGQTALILAAIGLPHGGTDGSAWTAAVVVLGIAMMCNATHSILGTAAAMDLGGRKMAGCSSGIIDSFQYYGALLSGYGMGWLFDVLGSSPEAAAKGAAGGRLDTTVWFGSMLPFAVLGSVLMVYLWLRHRGADTRGT